MEEKKQQAKSSYYKAQKVYLENPTNENWIKFCNARILCRHLGVII